ncbi:MAG: dodecin domain-containing protein [Proteobacteria bacterium]|nr:dodecin domain-containing protein [Pseudomonadota bacterium]
MDHVYKTLEITGSSSIGFQEAIDNGLRRAGKTIRDMRWFQIIETRGAIDGDNVSQWQVTMKIGFTLED